MGEITLVRHGQANSDARDEAGYDRLSELGHRQAAMLGDWLRDHEAAFDAVHSGTLRRHVETARAMGVDGPGMVVDARLNELDYFNLGQALEAVHGVPVPGPDDFITHAPRVMEAWHRAEIRGNESFAGFEARITAALSEAATEGRRVLFVTSGGVIAMVMRHILGLDPARFAHAMMPVVNTSISRVRVTGDQMLLTGFNAAPHFDAPDFMGLRTIY